MQRACATSQPTCYNWQREPRFARAQLLIVRRPRHMVDQLGPYRIERLLGRGGMGTVYVGVHQETGQRAAVKSLSISLSEDTNLRERFLTEIETLKKLKHPNIVELYGDGEQDGQLFYAMELIDGPTLQEELHAGRHFDWHETTRIGIEVCQALKHAHDRGIIHRDLKPANLLCTKTGPIKLSDFGIAKLFGVTHLTAHGSVVGTADYMAPEQAEGQPITNRTDLYSLGAVLFTLLTRRPPFVGANLPQVFQKLRHEEAPPVRRFAPDTPPELEQIIQQLLQKDPSNRIPTALAVANRLKAMRHALTKQEQDSEYTLAPMDEPSLPPESATRAMNPVGPSTEVPPTAVMPPTREPPPAGEGPGTEATVLGSPWPSAPPSGKSPARPTVAEKPPRSANRFTWRKGVGSTVLADDDLQSAVAEHSLWQIAGLVGTLLLIIMLVAWAAWPPSADTLHQRIVAVTREKEPAEAIRDIDQFLRRFPQDPRRSEIALLRKDVECDWLQSRLALKELKSGGSTLEPFERQLLTAMRLKTKDVRAAEKILRDVVRQYGREEQPSRSLQSCLEAADHLLRRIGEQPAPASPTEETDASLRRRPIPFG